MKAGLIKFLPVILILTAGELTADSPLTSTNFADNYLDVEMVVIAKASGVVTHEIADYLSDPDVAVDYKAAVVNALGWDINGKNNYELYRKFLAEFYDTTPDELVLEDLTADELMALGYMKALDNYFDVKAAVPILEMARDKKDESMTVALVLSLVYAQIAMDSDWCRVWTLYNDTVSDDTLEIDMRETAIMTIEDYMYLYQEYCD